MAGELRHFDHSMASDFFEFHDMKTQSFQFHDKSQPFSRRCPKSSGANFWPELGQLLAGGLMFSVSFSGFTTRIDCLQEGKSRIPVRTWPQKNHRSSILKQKNLK